MQREIHQVTFPFIGTTQNTQINKDTKICGCLSLRRGDYGIVMSDFGASFWGNENVLQLHGSNDNRVTGSIQ